MIDESERHRNDGPPRLRRPAGARPLRDGTGTDLGWTVVDLDSEPARAEPLVRARGVDARHLARVVAIDLAGMRVATDDEELAHALIATGGALVRHATVMITHPQPPGTTVPAPPAGYEVVAFDSLRRAPTDLAEPLTDARVAAYHPSHPDHDPAADRTTTKVELRALLSGTVLGPVDPALSAMVQTTGDRPPAGAIIVTCPPEDAIWRGGPWIADLFVHPRHAGHGLGRRLLHHTLSVCGQLARPRLGLAVTHTNPATDLYRSAGFTDLFHSWALLLPHRPSR